MRPSSCEGGGRGEWVGVCVCLYVWGRGHRREDSLLLTPPAHHCVAQVDDEELHVRLQALVRHGVAQEEGEERRRAERARRGLERRDEDAGDVVHEIVHLGDEEAAANDGLEQAERRVLPHGEVQVRAHDDEEGLPWEEEGVRA